MSKILYKEARKENKLLTGRFYAGDVKFIWFETGTHKVEVHIERQSLLKWTNTDSTRSFLDGLGINASQLTPSRLFDGLFQMSFLTIHDMMLCSLLSNLPWKLSTVFDRRIVTKRLSHVLSWVWPKSYTNCFSTWFSFIFVCFFPSISVVRCCYESSLKMITCHVTSAF